MKAYQAQNLVGLLLLLYPLYIFKHHEKKSLKKLALRKVRISALEKSALNGGIDLTTIPTETIQFTACYGNQQCQFYETGLDCQDRTRRC
ncbi:hypothetical protein [Ascidiimonas aurantiaca]|uniref:hypothetical protein n=1 Tax=Ascidiimonas aurantiaca TaxID=1685432 RepID=UPI0030EF9512